MIKKNRIFVPLSSEPYNWFRSGKKKWELRKYGRQYTEKNVQKGRLVELRRGYSNPEEAIWGKIVDVLITDNLDEFYKRVTFSEVIPISESLNQAKQITESILRLQNLKEYKLIGFKVSIERDKYKSNTPDISRVRIVDHLLISDEYFNLILSGEKKTTIRRNYIAFSKTVIPIRAGNRITEININSIDYRKTFGMLNDQDAIADGFESVELLKAALKKFYDGISDNTPMTIIHFSHEVAK